MQQIKELLENYRREIIIGAAVIVVLVGIWLTAGQRRSPGIAAESGTPVTSTHASQTTRRPRKVVVDVKGAVNHPGVYHLAHGDRIAEAVNQAGGFRADADGNQVNLAKQVSDQQMIYIPMKGEQVQAAANTGTSGQQTDNKTVNLNTATKEQLTTITGIGDKKADLILNYRQQHGQFERVEDLKNITGFGDKTIAKIKDQLSV